MPKRRLAMDALRTAVMALAMGLLGADPAPASERGAAGPRPILVLPHNVASVPPEFLADGGEIMDAVLAAELRQQGLDFVQLSLVDGVRRWVGAIEAVGGLVVGLEGVEPESVERARTHMLQALIREFDASAILWPDLELRNAKRDGYELQWDGVSRSIPGYRKGFRSPRRGSSLHLRVYDRDAKLLQDALHGLEVVDRVLTLKRIYGYGFRRVWYDHRVRDDLFEDEGTLGEATRRVLPRVWP